MSTTLKVCHYQAECTPGDFAANLKKVQDGIAYGRRHGAHVQTFPESFLNGYFSDSQRAWQNSLRRDGPELTGLIQSTAGCPMTVIVGFNEARGDELYNTAAIIRDGELAGCYSKAIPCMDYFTPGREFPVFKANGVTFGVVICADGGYVEPCRILMYKGAQVVFAPHYNYIDPAGLLRHFTFVRSDHTARAVENGIWFMRCNNVSSGYDAGLDRPGVGYGDSYLVDPSGEIQVRSRRGYECFLQHTIEFDAGLMAYRRNRVMLGHDRLNDILQDAAAANRWDLPDQCFC